jgi:hypothetical protein
MYKENVKPAGCDLTSPHEKVNIAVRELEGSIERLESFVYKVRGVENKDCEVNIPPRSMSLADTLAETPNMIGELRSRIYNVYVALDELLFGVHEDTE